MSLSKGILGTFFSRIGTILISFIYSIFLTRLLGVEGNGVFAIYVANISLFIMILTLGLNPALTHYIAKGRINKERILSTLTYLTLISTSIFAFIIFGFGELILPYAVIGLEYKTILVFCFFSMFAITFIPSILSAFEKFKTINILRIVLVLNFLVVYLVMYIYHTQFTEISFKSILIAFSAVQFVQLVLSIILMQKDLNLTITYKALSLDTFKLLFTFAGISYFANTLQFLNYRLDYWIVEKIAGTLSLGTYALAFSLLQKMWILPSSIAFVLLPIISKNASKSTENLIIVGRITFWFLIFLGLFFLLFLKPIIVLLYGNDFIQTYDLFIILLIGGIPFSLTTIYASYFAGIGAVKINLIGTLIGLVFTVILDFVLIPQYGNYGAAIASTFSYLLSSIYIIYMLKIKTDHILYDLLFIKKDDIQILKQLKRKML